MLTPPEVEKEVADRMVERGWARWVIIGPVGHEKPVLAPPRTPPGVDRAHAASLYENRLMRAREEIAAEHKAERKATIGSNRRKKKKTLAYDALEPLAKGREKRGGVSLWKACHEVTEGRSEDGKRLYDRIQEKRRLDKG